MTQGLAPHMGKRLLFRGYFDRIGSKSFANGETVLIQNVELDGEIVEDHTWIQQAENFLPLDVKKGEKVQFTAVVMDYKKEGRKEYSLHRPCDIVLIERCEPKSQPTAMRIPELASKLDKPTDYVKLVVAPEPPKPKPTRKKLDILNDLHLLSVEVGGVEALRKLLEFLE